MRNDSKKKRVVIIGDSFNNTLGLIRSLGEAGANIHLILVGDDRLYVSKSRYVSECINCYNLNECYHILLKHSDLFGSYLICTNDKAAEWIDTNEYWLKLHYITPMRGGQLGLLLNKGQQCQLAKSFGISVPESIILSRSNPCLNFNTLPILLKPENSNKGEKSDIHVCYSIDDIKIALEMESKCNIFIAQQYIEKEFEINLIGISTDFGVVIPGGIKKIRHYPNLYSPCSFGLFDSVSNLGIDILPIQKMIVSTGYKGPFSVELLWKDGIAFFMEINFRHDGLAYAATASGVNLLKMYIDCKKYDYSLKPTFMMDLSTDYWHVKKGNISIRNWIIDFIKTECQLNFNRKDPLPTLYYYLTKIFH